MMSPDLRPARSAGEASDTEDTSTPVVSTLPKLFARSGVTDAGINPLPHRRPIPVWMGGESEVVVHRAAKMAGGCMPHFRPTSVSA
jgi:alkanesulfonate monooxygenase SsuD/methylene tetrahydromethanopterin reductase-like flavin-dependent oxidoreductase (luciferase family)